MKIPFLFGRDFSLELHESGRLQGVVSSRQSRDFQQAQHDIPWLTVQNCKEVVAMYALCKMFIFNEY
jgi:hypothetical protein